ncbi:N-acetylmuramoyl-L-alanine amidase [Massilia sp. W12]|uniref:N-acetylmuramoyl-L-alanine amidase family protein n=1 Tax=Massilia sp. W12 TaxID=3126507 RepID=UPI0030CD33FD
MKSLLLSLLCCVSACATAPARESVIALDIGHFHAKPGVISARGAREFDFNLALAQRLAQDLQQAGQAHVLIGADGMASDLAGRAASAAKQRASLLVSLHHDSVQERYLQHWEWQGAAQRFTRHAQGYSLFVSRKNPAWRASLLCAQALARRLQAAGFQHSRHHAENIPGENRPWADAALGVHYFDDLVVLKSASMPALLFEAGVLAHPDEELRLQDPLQRARMSAALHQGLQDCSPLLP